MLSFFVQMIPFTGIHCLGGVCMYRKNHLHGCCCLVFGLGLILGHCLGNWFLCCGGGLVLIGLGFGISRKR